MFNDGSQLGRTGERRGFRHLLEFLVRRAECWIVEMSLLGKHSCFYEHRLCNLRGVDHVTSLHTVR